MKTLSLSVECASSEIADALRKRLCDADFTATVCCLAPSNQYSVRVDAKEDNMKDGLTIFEEIEYANDLIEQLEAQKLI